MMALWHCLAWPGPALPQPSRTRTHPRNPPEQRTEPAVSHKRRAFARRPRCAAVRLPHPMCALPHTLWFRCRPPERVPSLPNHRDPVLAPLQLFKVFAPTEVHPAPQNRHPPWAPSHTHLPGPPTRELQPDAQHSGPRQPAPDALQPERVRTLAPVAPAAPTARLPPSAPQPRQTSKRRQHGSRPQPHADMRRTRLDARPHRH